MTLRIGMPDGTKRDATQEEIDELARYASVAETPAQYQARAKEKARVLINQARQAVANMIAKRTETDAAMVALRTLQSCRIHRRYLRV
jgi:agmatine/peptidylarginine deiminase